MANLLIGVIYGTVSGRHIATLIPGPEVDDNWLQDPARLRPGQSMATVAKAGLKDHYIETLAAAIIAAGGPTILPAAPCVVVDANNNVVDRLMADPVLCQPPQAVTARMTDNLAGINTKLQAPIAPLGPFTLVQHDTAAVGGTLVKGVYAAPVLAVAVVDAPLS